MTITAAAKTVVAKEDSRNPQERKAWLNENKDKIAAFLKRHTVVKTKKEFRTSYQVLKRLGLVPRQKTKVEEVGGDLSPEELLEMLLKKVAPEKVLVMIFKGLDLDPGKITDTLLSSLPADTNIGFLITRGLMDKIEDLTVRLKQSQSEADELKTDQQRLVVCFEGKETRYRAEITTLTGRLRRMATRPRAPQLPVTVGDFRDAVPEGINFNRS